MKIAVAMSGGVDSSTAAYILKSGGHDVVGLSMQMYDNLSNADSPYGGCCTIDDLADARVHALAHLGAAGGNHHGAVGVDVDQRIGLVHLAADRVIQSGRNSRELAINLVKACCEGLRLFEQHLRPWPAAEDGARAHRSDDNTQSDVRVDLLAVWFARCPGMAQARADMAL